MHKAGKFELLNVAEVDGRWPYTFSGTSEVFSVVRPGVGLQMSVPRRRACPPGLVGQPMTYGVEKPPASNARVAFVLLQNEAYFAKG